MQHLMEAYTWVSSHTVTYLQVLVLFSLLFVVWVYVFNRKPSARRETQMATVMTERQVKEERSDLADAYFEALFKLYGEGKLTRERFKYRLHQVACECGLPDLLPKLRMSHPDALRAQAKLLKRTIQERLSKEVPEEKIKAALSRGATTKAKAYVDKRSQGNGKLNVPMKAQGA